MAVNTTQGIVLAIFGANAGGHLTSLEANATANGNASLATDLSAAAGLILGVDLSTDAAFTSTVLGNLGIAEDSAGYTLASNYFTTNLAAGAGRGDLVAAAVEYLLGSNVDASLTDSATAFSASVTAGVEYSQGAGATVFGVAQLQTAAGNTASAGEGSTFVLTSSDDTLSGTSGNDTFSGTTADLSADDRILDSSTSDNDVFNLTASGDPEAMDVTNVENININWDAFGTADVNLDNVSGATVTLTSAKTGYMGNAAFTNVGENSISLGAGVTGDVTIAALEDASVTATVAESLTITGADGNVTVNAGAAETVVVSGADSVNLVALSADDITVQNAFDDATITVGIDADVLVDGAADATVVINSDADVQLDVNATFEAETVTLGGTGAITLDFADSTDVSGLEIVNGGAIILADADTTLDLDQVTHTAITVESTLTGASTFTAADDVALVFEEDFDGGALDLVLTTTNDTSSDIATVTFEKTTTAALDVAVATNTDFETLNIIADGSSDITLNSIVATGNTVTLASPTNDLTVTSIAAETIDASAMTTDLTLTQATAADVTVSLGSGDNDINLIGTTHENTVTGVAGDDDVTFLTTTGTAAALLADGDNVVAVSSITSGEAIITTGSGDDTITVDKFTSAEVSITAGDGENTINLDPGTLAGAEVTVTMGNGDDTVKYDSAGAVTAHADDVISLSFGTGTDTLDFASGSAAIDLTAGSFTVDSLEVIAFGGQSSNVTLDAALLNGQSYQIQGDGDTADLVFVDIDSAGSYDFSSLQIDGTIAKAMGGMDIDGHSGNDTIVATDGGDVIDTGDGVNTVTGGLGADSITLGTGKDTVVLGKKTDTQISTFAGANTTADHIDEYIGFDFGAEDKIQLSSAAEAYGSGITLSSSTVINVTEIALGTTEDNITDLLAKAQSVTNGTASTSTTLYVYYAVETGAGTLEDGTYMIINDGTSTLGTDDTIIKIGDGNGVTSLDASDFTIV